MYINVNFIITVTLPSRGHYWEMQQRNFEELPKLNYRPRDPSPVVHRIWYLLYS